jgi:hypothetical protein
MHFYIKCITYDYSIDIGKEISSLFYTDFEESHCPGGTHNMIFPKHEYSGSLDEILHDA